MRTIFVSAIRGYQWLISPLLGTRCRFYPSCSNYAIGSIQHHGVMRGIFLAGPTPAEVSSVSSRRRG